VLAASDEQECAAYCSNKETGYDSEDARWYICLYQCLSGQYPDVSLLPAAHRHLGENGNFGPPISNGTKVVMARGASYVASTPAASYAPMAPFTVTSTVTTTETELVTECSSAPFEPIMSTPDSFVVPYPSTSEGSM